MLHALFKFNLVSKIVKLVIADGTKYLFEIM